jgi:hypothetical protein
LLRLLRSNPVTRDVADIGFVPVELEHSSSTVTSVSCGVPFEKQKTLHGSRTMAPAVPSWDFLKADAPPNPVPRHQSMCSGGANPSGGLYGVYLRSAHNSVGLVPVR